MAGATEHEFLHVGNRLQDIYQRSSGLSRTAGHLVEIASGERIASLIERLHHILTEMETYLSETEATGAASSEIMDSVSTLLQQVAGPLEVFKRMSRTLYMFEVSIKIESAHLGDAGDEFLNLALDIRKLSHEVKTKAVTLHDNRRLLISLLAKNIAGIGSASKTQNEEVRKTLASIETSLEELRSANERFAGLGNLIAATSEDNSQHISSVVESMQIHDIFRQQVEHVIEALEGLFASLSTPRPANQAAEQVWVQEMMSRAGDVCELQEAQLQFAADEFHSAVASVVESLGEISEKQHQMTGSIYDQSGIADISGGSFIDEVSNHMAASTSLLTGCARQNHDMAATMQEITSTVEKMTGFVNDIEEIGKEIIHISLNARIKAAITGTEGDSLSALAEEIGELSNEVVEQTDVITGTLTEIHSATTNLSSEVNNLETTLTDRVMGLESESETVLDTLGAMGKELVRLVAGIRNEADPLSRELETLCQGIDVHVRIREKAETIMNRLKAIFVKAREYCPASVAFKEGLRRMEEKYTMESERRIHEAIARRHQLHPQEREELRSGYATTPSEDTESEFGDNVDLF